MIHFFPNMYVSGKISALRPCTQTVKNFWNSKKIRKLPKQRDFRICGFLRFLAGFCGNFAGFLRGFAGFLPDRLRRCKYFLSFVSPSSKTCNQSLKIEDLGVLGKISWYRSNSENTYIFLGFGGSRHIVIWSCFEPFFGRKLFLLLFFVCVCVFLRGAECTLTNVPPTKGCPTPP